MNLSINSTTGDLDFVKGQLVFVDGQEEIRQHLEQRLRTFLNEWFLDLTIGVPYYDEILKKNINPSTIDAIFIDEILACPGVVRLLSFDLDLDNTTRKLSLNAEIQTTDGVIDFSTETI